MGIFSRKKKTPPESSETLQTSFQGHEMQINPPPELKLPRMRERLARVTKSIEEGKWPEGSPKLQEMTRIKRRLEMQLKVKTGDY